MRPYWLGEETPPPNPPIIVYVQEWAIRGRAFEEYERAGWVDGDWLEIIRERSITLQNGKRGRIDLIADLGDYGQVVVEMKSTEWDSIHAKLVGTENEIEDIGIAYAIMVVWRD